MKKLFLIFVCTLISLCGYAQNVNVGCSIWRRDVKTLTDLNPVELNTLLGSKPLQTTVGELISIGQPDPLTNNAKWENEPRYGSEKKLVRVRAIIVACGKEANDHDYHIVIANPDDPNETMVSEIPDPDCADVAEHALLRERYRALRDWFDENITTPTSKIQALETSVEVEIIGVPFWDGKHPGNVNGAAPNFRELHPILNFVKDGVFAVKQAEPRSEPR